MMEELQQREQLEQANKTLETHLVHHGFGDFGETLVLHAHRDDLVTIRALTGFVPAETANRPAVISGPIVGPTDQSGQGIPAQGYFDQFTVVLNNDIPSGYLLAMAVGGDMAASAPVGLRVHENPSARGLRLIEGPRQNYPLYDSVYDGYVGAGIAQRGSAVVMKVATAYSDPTF